MEATIHSRMVKDQYKIDGGKREHKAKLEM